MKRSTIDIWVGLFVAAGDAGRVVTSADGLTWTCSDLVSDGTHPSTTGRTKVANALLAFFQTDSTAREWFLR